MYEETTVMNMFEEIWKQTVRIDNIRFNKANHNSSHN